MKKEKPLWIRMNLAVGIIILLLTLSVGMAIYYGIKYDGVKLKLDMISQTINMLGPTDSQVFCMGFRYDKGQFSSIELPVTIKLGNMTADDVVIRIIDPNR